MLSELDHETHLSSTYVPTISEHIFYASSDERHLFFNTIIPDWIVVNVNAAWILGQANGSNTVQDIISLAKDNGAKEEQTRMVLEMALEHGVFACSDKTLSAEPHSSGKQNNNKNLRIVHLKLTNNCNLNCSYCYANSGERSEILSMAELTHLANQVCEITDNASFVLSGGEPLLHPDALSFAELVKSLGHQTYLLTNGVAITNKNVERIVNCIDHVKISIDGSTPEINGITRDSKSFAATVSAAEELSRYDIDVKIAMVVHRKNLHDVPDMVNKWGSALTFQPLFKAGRGEDSDDLYITGKEYFSALSNVPGVNPLRSLGQRLDAARGIGIKKCAMGDGEISISNNGDVYPCQMLEDPKFLAGNIRNNTLSEIYYDSPKLNEVCTITIDNVEECKTCPIRLVCGGACRARSFYETNDIYRSGDFCEYEKLAFVYGLLNGPELVD